MPEKFKHIFLDKSGEISTFKNPPSRGTSKVPSRDRQSHGQAILRKLKEALQENEQRTAASVRNKEGIYVEFESAPDHDLKTKSLEDLRSGIRLLNIREVKKKDGLKVVHATVYIPRGKENIFLKKIRQYAEEETQKGEPKNKELINSIENIRLAVVGSFWGDNRSLIPEKGNAKWCEIWLRLGESNTDQHFQNNAGELGIELQDSQLDFPERKVVLAKVDQNQLVAMIESCDDIAEFRLAKETARFFLELNNEEQTEWVNNLLSRLSVSKNPVVRVTVLDTGANNGHDLLQPILQSGDCHTVEPNWGKHDHHGHGTLMCGLAGYGDLQDAIDRSGQIEISHCLESVKILPPQGNNEQKLYGDLTIQGVNRAEIQAPNRHRIVCMAVTSEDTRDCGKPSSWSAAIDALTSGCDGNQKQLFIVAAGNVDGQNEWSNYFQSNLTNSVHDPGQSWNAMTVGAFTDKAYLTDPTLTGYEPIAPAEGLSPFSSTSRIWGKKWPSKPDIVLEGGNLARDSSGFISQLDDLGILSTGYEPNNRQFDFINATSAATAQAAWMAAQIQTTYQDAWPETVRGLMVHSAQWTEEMKNQFLDSKNRTGYTKLLRTCGYGVPNLDRALSCYRNHLTLISQEEIQPFDKDRDSSRYITKDMHLHNLPWPKEDLLSLGNTTVTLRITLSYFIEPGPGDIGWKDRYRYASHAFRFDLNNVDENQEQFLKRINRAAREEGDEVNSSNSSSRWQIGSKGRNFGSIHSDTWTGTAANLATCNMIGIYPVIGWWRERHWLQKWDSKTRYSLIVSIDTPEKDVDIYTPVANIVGIHIPIS